MRRTLIPRDKRLPLERLTPYLVSLPEPPQTLDFVAIFGNAHPVELEVGFGKGGFLLQCALHYPQINFVGIEIEKALVLYVATRLAKRGLPNVRLIHGDARRILPSYFADQSLQAVHVYFPDPWWKRRHHKRRLFQQDFVGQCERILCPGGRLLMASDVAEYFEVMKGLVRTHTQLQETTCPEPPADQQWLTNFERKALQQGRSVFRATYVKGDVRLKGTPCR
ncbi:MAG: tRNA (guanosine(46)-N7)-methyltransferase TrmB [Gemmatales bacterium]|nr:tRNA (guanosine(46)-N7)-methyltransferase TrmB [Gemmatales bacterium]MCS7160869.1 tRNA (guanosine(46)-N7)-methyltransferase TrmB [Gemmatales bacterium]MDW8176071.1 tRNA (guanosine(46)-N7)-methyltransferase TrmB [Gemmatales bacterium]MDW8221734.1 tRNA (guanosine(46)-N7)-methyltransferase TrmB [Gemmatales bacterium]